MDRNGLGLNPDLLALWYTLIADKLLTLLLQQHFTVSAHVYAVHSTTMTGLASLLALNKNHRHKEHAPLTYLRSPCLKCSLHNCIFQTVYRQTLQCDALQMFYKSARVEYHPVGVVSCSVSMSFMQSIVCIAWFAFFWFPLDMQCSLMCNFDYA